MIAVTFVLNKYLLDNNIIVSACQTANGTETAPIQVKDDIMSIFQSKAAVFVLLHLSSI